MNNQFDITKHKWSDESLTVKDVCGALCFQEVRGVYASKPHYFNKDDAIAIAKHFKHYRNIEQLTNIAKQLQYWIEFSGKDDGDSHIIPPMWPTKGQLKNWIKALNDDDINNTFKQIPQSVDQVITGSILENIHQSETTYPNLNLDSVGKIKESELFNKGDDLHE